MKTYKPTTKLLMTTMASLVTLSPLTPSVWAQGTLTPPGAPAPTMKTLDQVEPRIPISSLPYTISSSGSYYLTGPLTSTNTGITVSANHVTVDLMGFTIYGSGSTVHPGIHIAGGNEVMRHNVVLRNGGITLFGMGIQVDNTLSGVIKDLVIHQNTAGGIKLESHDPGLCANFTVETCTITDNNGPGIQAFSPNDPKKNYSHKIRNNTISGNLGYGIHLIRTKGCLVDGNYFGEQIYDGGICFAVRSSYAQNIVVRNFEYNNSTNVFGTAYFSFGGSDTFGPRVKKSGTLQDANYENHPWANFEQ